MLLIMIKFVLLPFMNESRASLFAALRPLALNGSYDVFLLANRVCFVTRVLSRELPDTQNNKLRGETLEHISNIFCEFLLITHNNVVSILVVL